ncbi:hypothetical protein M406DRAFT_337181 [Cryphonectria parasitica EP155]|uniref:Uncharacterized protein n=1 Tax=Cryphonectria parasitica (strain ATCC 38755 / EP155) TaxID=660469 RepID=A0A9P4Y9F4_CRYP1|nr:uncharacterized protein M406DRAFT_337181 [Cryphonectria parasitica EP155]KAF3768839.1 hypothetical protein M406DRAFT_337181 [Cryphonectria parasitica EP155]
MTEDDDESNDNTPNPSQSPPKPSQTSSHFPQEPISGTTLFETEARRRDILWDHGRGNITTGCREIDESVLVGGGFERGCVVGVSAEDEHCGLVLGLQTLVRCLLARKEDGEGKGKPRVMIITAAAVRSVVSELRAVLTGQITALGLETGAREEKGTETGSFLTDCLERVAVSRVFDIIGLWEALAELDQPPPPSQEVGEGQEPPSSQPRNTDDDFQYSTMDDPLSMVTEEDEVELPRRTPPGQREEIPDSQEEDLLSSPLEPKRALSPRAYVETSDDDNTAAGDTIKEMKPELIFEKKPGEDPALERPAHVKKQEESTRPDMILITHMSKLLRSLFIQRQRNTAHEMVQLVASHLRYISRSPEHGGPLIMILNSTTSSDPEESEDPEEPEDAEGPEKPEHLNVPSDHIPAHSRPLDPTLCSIFDQPPLPISEISSVYAYDTPQQHSRRRNKPSFGLIFSQMLDMHLLCTTLPKTRADAESLYAPGTGVARQVEYARVVEVLLDDMGVWEGREKVVDGGGGPRTCREQNWGAVEVRQDRSGLRVVDAFEREKEKKLKEVVLAAGFGGPRV